MSPRGPSIRGPRKPNRNQRDPGLVVGIPDLDDDRLPVFSFVHADRDYAGAWSWPTADEAEEILHFLCEMSQRTWSEIMGRHGGKTIHHEQGIDTVCPEAQARITALGHDLRFESLFRFGLGHKKRLWGFTTGGVFHVLWWDRDHQVYPVGLGQQ
jgi:hypothetical protein